MGTGLIAGAAVGVVTGAVIAGSMGDNHYGGGYHETYNSGPNYGYHEQDHGTSGWTILLWVLFGVGVCACVGFIVNQQQ